MFDEFHLGEQQPGIAHQAAPRLQHQLQFPPGQALGHGLGVGGQIGHLFVVVHNAHAAADVDVLQGNALGGQRVYQHQQALQCFHQRA